jgi:hypothetical protein
MLEFFWEALALPPSRPAGVLPQNCVLGERRVVFWEALALPPSRPAGVLPQNCVLGERLQGTRTIFPMTLRASMSFRAWAASVNL